MTVSETIIYEQPLNERIRTFLRLEFLFSRVEHSLVLDGELNNRDAIDGLLSILSVFERSDLKSEIIKELERLVSTLSALENTPGVDKAALDGLLTELDTMLDLLHAKKSSLGQSLRDNDFLYAIRQRSSIAGGSCDFDLPAYHFWLQHTSEEARAHQISVWLEQFSSARSAIEMTLRLIRSSIGFKQETATDGYYQQSLDSHQSHQLIRVKLPASVNVYPEISGGKHRFTVRFMIFDINQRAQQSTETIPFQLSCCAM